jgi:DNA-binding transcriptional LysR family regulator
VKEAIELDELQGIVQLVRRGAGVALLPSTAALSLPEGVVALGLGDATFFREVGLVERPAHSRQPAANLLALRILEAAQAQARGGDMTEGMSDRHGWRFRYRKATDLISSDQKIKIVR